VADKALETINAVLQNKDIGVLYGGSSVDELMGVYTDVWQTVKDFHARYHEIPDFQIIKERHPNLEQVEVKQQTKYYLDELRSEYIKNRTDAIITKGATALDKGTPSAAVLEKLQSELAKLNRFSGGATDTNIMDLDAAETHYEEVRQLTEARGGMPGIPTGISFWDSAYPTGLAEGDLIVLLGWTGRGKSLLAALLSCNAHDHEYIPMYCSLEMNAAKVRDRVFTIKGSGIFTNSSLSLGDISTDSFRDFRAKQEGKKEFIVITNEGGQELTPNLVEAKIDQHDARLVIVDYAQLASDNANSENMTQRMMNQSTQYKRLAVKKKVTIIVISSATAEGVAAVDAPPMVEQVAWSRQLAYDADLAISVHKYNESNLIDIVCRKNRNGPLFAGMLDWDINNGIVKEHFGKKE
jgi:replicative DNA helicase